MKIYIYTMITIYRQSHAYLDVVVGACLQIQLAGHD